MARPAVITLSMVESVEGFSDALHEAASDGVIDQEETTRLLRMWKPIPRKCAKLHESTQGAIRALTGDGIFSPWHKRMVRESHQIELRVVVRNDDGPEPSGPGGKKKAA